MATEIAQGLVALQHRGQDAAGIITLDDRFHMKKGAGLVSQVFPSQAELASLRGRMGLGHVRYPTQGTTDVFDAQPVAVNYPFGLAMVHNGNVTNFQELRERLNTEHHRLIETTNDIELILYTLAAELEKRDLARVGPAAILESVRTVQSKVEGAYSVIALVAGKGLLAFRDRHGIRPLVLGVKETPEGRAIALASETACFDCLEYKTVRDLLPGEIVFISLDGTIVSSHGDRIDARGGDRGDTRGREPDERDGRGDDRSDCGAFCAFEYIYFAREDSMLNGSLVAGARVEAGKRLAGAVRRAGVSPDIVIDVPSTAYFAASGLAEELGIPYRRGLTKNSHVGRSFIVPLQSDRERVVRQKLNPIRGVVSGKKVAVVDDSIVRGTTSRHIVRLLREAGATEVYFVSASPPVKHRCVYGIDMSTKHEILAATHTLEEIRDAIGADAVIYQSLEDLREVYRGLAGCYACFSGEYPTHVNETGLNLVEAERLVRKSERTPGAAR